MIKLTRLDGNAFVLNAELIRFIEKRPDTFVTLTTGERIVVLESMEEVIDAAIDYQQRKNWMPRPHTLAHVNTPASNDGLADSDNQYSGTCKSTS